jgi:hypothetical protein
LQALSKLTTQLNEKTFELEVCYPTYWLAARIVFSASNGRIFY